MIITYETFASFIQKQNHSTIHFRLWRYPVRLFYMSAIQNKKVTKEQKDNEAGQQKYLCSPWCRCHVAKYLGVNPKTIKENQDKSSLY